MHLDTNLPIDSLLDAIRAQLCEHNELILEAPPGAGKTTRVPLALMDQPWLGDQKILLLEPRRLSAKAAAQRLAQQLGEAVGERVGYRIRLESKVSARTRIEVVTEGILTRMLQDDPGLENIGLIIFDEFHERSLDADIGLALTLQGRELLREGPPLKLLLMSATLDGEAISTLLDGAPILRSEGRAHPVEIVYSTPSRVDTPIEERVVSRVLQALDRHSGSQLVFLPGQREIRRVEEQLQERLEQNPDVLLTPLYGNLALQEQQRAISPAEPGQRKVVLATSIAETSLTIEGIEVVIDAGLSRQARFDPASGMTRLLTTRVSAAAATQRAGRAGRLGPGTCYRLWSEEQQHQLSPQTPPEILHADLAPLALQLLQWGVDDPGELCWLDPPPASSYQQALDLLHQLEAIETTTSGHWRLTPRGQQMTTLPAHPRLAHMLVCGAEQGYRELASDVAALLTERDPLKTTQADLQQRVDWVRSNTQGAAKRIQQLAKQYQRLSPDLATALKPEQQVRPEQALGYLVACAYPDRIAQQRKQPEHFRLSQGRGARLASEDRLTRHRWLAVGSLNSHQDSATDRIQLAAELDPALFENSLSWLTHDETFVDWDRQQDRLIAEERHCIGQLCIAYKPIERPDPQLASTALMALIRREGLTLLNWTEAALQLQTRLQFVRSHAPDPESWPDLSNQTLEKSTESWLLPWLDGVKRREELKRLDLHSILLGQLDWEQQQALERLAPERIQVPSGSRHLIDYSQSPPVLAVKLQEMFGCGDTPTLGFGVAVSLHLLSPARRPLQVTQDLAGFWQGSYKEVRKEMKGRYPKHPWPEDPASAVATARTKRALGNHSD